MATATAARTVRDGDAEYDELWKQWVRNGRSYQFDWTGATGGYIAHVYNRELERPDIHIHAEAGPTVFDETLPGGQKTLGWAVQVIRRGSIRYVPSTPFGGRSRLTKNPLPRLPRNANV